MSKAKAKAKEPRKSKGLVKVEPEPDLRPQWLKDYHAEHNCDPPVYYAKYLSLVREFDEFNALSVPDRLRKVHSIARELCLRFTCFVEAGLSANGSSDVDDLIYKAKELSRQDVFVGSVLTTTREYFTAGHISLCRLEGKLTPAAFCEVAEESMHAAVSVEAMNNFSDWLQHPWDFEKDAPADDDPTDEDAYWRTVITDAPGSNSVEELKKWCVSLGDIRAQQQATDLRLKWECVQALTLWEQIPERVPRESDNPPDGRNEAVPARPHKLGFAKSRFKPSPCPTCEGQRHVTKVEKDVRLIKCDKCETTETKIRKDN